MENCHDDEHVQQLCAEVSRLECELQTERKRAAELSQTVAMQKRVMDDLAEKAEPALEAEYQAILKEYEAGLTIDGARLLQVISDKVGSFISNPFRDLPAVHDVLQWPAILRLETRYTREFIAELSRRNRRLATIPCVRSIARWPCRTGCDGVASPNGWKAISARSCARSSTPPASSCTPTSAARRSPRRPPGAAYEAAARLPQPRTRPRHRQALLAAGRRPRLAVPAHRGRVGDRGQQQRRRHGHRPAGAGRGQGSDRLARPAHRDRRQLPHPRDHGRQRRRSSARSAPPTSPACATTRRPSAPNTGALMQVHTSNYRVRGFTEVGAARRTGRARPASTTCPVIDDIGSGALIDFARFGFAGEPVVGGQHRGRGRPGAVQRRQAARRPAGRASSPGERSWIQRIEKDPLMRAFRLDKMTLAAPGSDAAALPARRSALARCPCCACSGQSDDQLRMTAERLAARLRPVPGLAGRSTPVRMSPMSAAARCPTSRSRHGSSPSNRRRLIPMPTLHADCGLASRQC